MKGWRTYIVMGLPALLAAINATIDVLDVSPQAEVGIIVMAVIGAIMRTITNSPPGRRPAPVVVQPAAPGSVAVTPPTIGGTSA